MTILSTTFLMFFSGLVVKTGYKFSKNITTESTDEPWYEKGHDLGKTEIPDFQMNLIDNVFDDG